MKLTVLGCSGSYASTESPASSYLLTHTDGTGREWRVLIDIGNGSLSNLQKVMDPSELDAILISHLHADHFLDLAGLEVLLAYHPMKTCRQIKVYAPAAAATRLQAATGNELPTPPGAKRPAFLFTDLADGLGFQIGDMRVTAGTVNHPVEAYGFRIEADGRVFVYSGDTDTCEELPLLAKDADLFLCEAGYIEGRDDHIVGLHLTGKRAGLAAAQAQAKRLVLTHIPAWTDPTVPHAEARAVFSGTVELATPLADYTV